MRRNALVESRLLVTGRDEVTGEQTIELAHAALIGQWQTLQGWLNDYRGTISPWGPIYHRLACAHSIVTEP
ncbi:MAG: hypothetical protein GY759_09940 [Chloroflexi bacterium]|nr:hypothetical protein [Chloroflexota bacterium]